MERLLFLSEEAERIHREYLRRERLKYSVLEKSVPRLSGVGIKEISRLKIKKEDKREAECLLGNILAHELYFSSFCKNLRKSAIAREQYGSEQNLLYAIYLAALESEDKFLLISRSGDKASFYTTSHPEKHLAREDVRLALDLCEHAYFLDYGFDREKYLKMALYRLDLSKLD